MNFGSPNPYSYSPYMGLESSRHYGSPSASMYGDSSVLSLDQPGGDYGTLFSEGNTPSHLDAITDEILAPKKEDPMQQFLDGKKSFLAKSVDEILGLIYEREYIKDKNVYRIDHDSCYISGRLYEIYYIPIGLNPQIDKLRVNLEREMIAFEREKRMEEVACWRDISRLKGELREAMREFSQEKRKQQLLSDESS